MRLHKVPVLQSESSQKYSTKTYFVTPSSIIATLIMNRDFVQNLSTHGTWECKISYFLNEWGCCGVVQISSFDEYKNYQKIIVAVPQQASWTEVNS